MILLHFLAFLWATLLWWTMLQWSLEVRDRDLSERWLRFSNIKSMMNSRFLLNNSETMSTLSILTNTRSISTILWKRFYWICIFYNLRLPKRNSNIIKTNLIFGIYFDTVFDAANMRNVNGNLFSIFWKKNSIILIEMKNSWTKYEITGCKTVKNAV